MRRPPRRGQRGRGGPAAGRGHGRAPSSRPSARGGGRGGRVQRLVYMSTMHVYGERDRARGPRSPRTCAPSRAELRDRAAGLGAPAAGSRATALDLVVLRLTNAVGAPDDPAVDRWTLVANDLCRQGAVDGAARAALRSGVQWRDFVGPGRRLRDHRRVPSSATRRFRRHLQPGVGCGSTTVRALAEMIQDAFERVAGPRARAARARARGPTGREPYHVSVDERLAAPRPARADRRSRTRSRRLVRFCLRSIGRSHRVSEIDGVRSRRCGASPTSAARSSTCCARTAPRSSASARSTSRSCTRASIKGWHLHQRHDAQLRGARRNGQARLLRRPRGLADRGATSSSCTSASSNYALVDDPAARVERVQGRGHRARAGGQLRHDAARPDEIERMDPFENDIPYDWELRPRLNAPSRGGRRREVPSAHEEETPPLGTPLPDTTSAVLDVPDPLPAEEPAAGRVAPGRSLRELAARGTLVNTGFTVAFSSLGLVKGFILAGFLSRADYGLWGIVVVALGTLVWLKQVGDRRQVRPAGRGRPGGGVPEGVHARAGRSPRSSCVLLAAMPRVRARLRPRRDRSRPALVRRRVVPASRFQAPLWIYYRRMDFVRQRVLQAIDPVVGFVVAVALAVAGAGLLGASSAAWSGRAASALVAVLKLAVPAAPALRPRHDAQLREVLVAAVPGRRRRAC